MTTEQWIRMGARIRTIRLQRDLTVQQLSDMIGISYSHMQDIEGGGRKATLEILLRTAEVLTVSMDYIILGVSPIPSAGDGTVRLRCDKTAQELSEEAEDENGIGRERIR